MPLETMLEAERYGQLTEREEQLAKEIREDMNERFNLIRGTFIEELENLQGQYDSIREDLEDNVPNGGGGWNSPLELIEDKYVRKRYATAIKDLVKLDDKIDQYLEELAKEELEK